MTSPTSENAQIVLFLVFTSISIITSLLLSIYYRNSTANQMVKMEIKAMCGKFVHGHHEKKTEHLETLI